MPDEPSTFPSDNPKSPDALPRDRSVTVLALLVLLVGLASAPLVRAPLDMHEYWLAWADASAQLGVTGPYAHATRPANYPPMWLYWIACVAHVRELNLVDPNGPVIWTLVKLPNILACALGVLVCGIGLRDRFGPLVARRAAIAWALFTPLYVNAALWAQTDAWLALFILLAVVHFLSRQTFWLGIAIGLALSLKLQTVVAGPVFALAVALQFGLRGIVRSGLGFLLAFSAVLLPMILAGAGASVRDAYLGQVDMVKLRQVSAYNLWLLLDTFDIVVRKMPVDLARSDLREVWPQLLPGLRYTHIGLFLFASSLLLILRALCIHRKSNPQILPAAVAISGAAFYILCTQMHSRYAVPCAAMLAVAFALDRRWRFIYLGFLITLTLNQGIYLARENHQQFLSAGSSTASAINLVTRSLAVLLSVANICLLALSMKLLMRRDPPHSALPTPN